MENQKNILIVAYYFPPNNAVGGQRPYGFSKHLSQNGWTPHVLTVKDSYFTHSEDKRPPTLELFQATRTVLSPGVVNWALQTIRRRPSEWIEYNHASATDQKAKPAKKSELMLSAVKRTANSFLYLPDEARNWILPAVLRACSLIQKGRMRAVITTCPPFSAHVIGLILKRMFRLPWVADFRDPWITPFNKKTYPTTGFSLRLEKAIEKRVIQSADLVLTTNESFSGFLHRAFADKRDSIITLPNGYEPDQFAFHPGAPKFNTFTICYTGSLYHGRTPEPLFKALAELKRDKMLGEGQVSLKFIGNCRYVAGVEMVDFAKEYQLEREIEVIPPVSHSEAINFLKKSHLCLILAPGQPYQVPAKIYDAIGTRTKVIAIAEKGATQAVIDANRIGKSFHPGQVAEIKDFILNEINGRSPDDVDWDTVQKKFDRRQIVSALSRKIEALLKN